ncbi:MAG: hypothetical protein M3227_06640, partial [Thermoproteota archaeon]|nr:hypothetical protein [Thermoproteota archaeon]
MTHNYDDPPRRAARFAPPGTGEEADMTNAPPPDDRSDAAPAPGPSPPPAPTGGEGNIAAVVALVLGILGILGALVTVGVLG